MKMLLDTHCHTVASGHAYSTVNEIVHAAVGRGLSLIAITDHAPAMPGSCGEFHFYNLRMLPRELEGVFLFSGVELNILDPMGTVDLPDALLKELDVVIASLHSPCYAPQTAKDHTRAIMNTMKNPYVNVIGHLGDPHYPFDLDAVLDAAVEHGVILEINNASLDPHALRKGDETAIQDIIRGCKARNWPVILGSDAHFISEVGNFSYVLPLVEQLGMPPELILNTSIDLFQRYIAHKK